VDFLLHSQILGLKEERAEMMAPREWEVEIVIEVLEEIEAHHVEISTTDHHTNLRIATVTVETGVKEVPIGTETIAAGLTVTEETVGMEKVELLEDSTKEARLVVKGAVMIVSSRERGTMAIIETDFSLLRICQTTKN